MTATKHFTFDLAGALARQLQAALPGLTRAPLALDALEDVQAVPGVYQLYLEEELVYIGKADKNLRGRLTEHHKKISGRSGISIDDMRFTGLYLEGTWIPVGPETMLINECKRLTGAKPLWNTNGFGSKDTGKERDTTNYKRNHFDVMYPIDLGYAIESLGQRAYSVKELLPILKQTLPYRFRFEDQRAKHSDYTVSRVTISQSPATVFRIFNALINALPSGWQITAFPGYVIMYKEIRPYHSARRVFTRQNTT